MVFSNKIKASSLVLLALTGACATPAPKDFVDQELSGRINGREWRYQHAYVDPTIETPEEDDLVFVFLSYKPKKPCPKANETGQDKRTVMISAPKQRQLTLLKGGTARNLVFHSEKGGKQRTTVAKSGKFKLTEVSDAVVKGKIFGTFNDSNWVSGNFSAVVCDWEEFR